MAPKIFVAWDTTIPNLSPVLDTARKAVRPDLELQIWGLNGDMPAGNAIDDIFESIDAADALLAIADKPNANLGMELGYAVARGKRWRLACAGAGAPWLLEPPFGENFVAPGIRELSILENLLRGFVQWPVRAPDEHGGEKRLALCPQRSVGSSFRWEIGQLDSTLTFFDHEDPWDPTRMPELLSGVGRLLWVVPQPDHEGDRDGPETARLALLAGYAVGAGLELSVLHHAGPRQILQSTRWVQRFVTNTELIDKAKRILAEWRAPQPKSERFADIEKIGEGHYGIISRALDREAGRLPCAIKYLKPEYRTVPEAHARFERELDITPLLQHPHVIAAERVELDGQPALKMELMRESLGDLIAREGPVDVDTVLHFAEQLFATLDYVHGQGVIHRDLKPKNILVDDRGELKLTDFGAAQIEDGQLTQEHPPGTPAFMSPEQRVNSAVGPTTDVFSAARVLHVLLLGDVRATSDPGVGVDRELGELLRALGTHDPSIRPSAAEALARVRELVVRRTRTRTAPAPGESEARRLGRVLRDAMDNPRLLDAGLRDRLAEADSSEGASALDTWTELRGSYLRVAWPGLTHALSLADLLRIPKLRWSEQRLLAALKDERRGWVTRYEYPSIRAARTQLRDPEAFARALESFRADAIELPILAGCLGYGLSRAYDEAEFKAEIEEILRRHGVQLQYGLRHAISGLKRDYRDHYVRKHSGELRRLRIPPPALAAVQRHIVRMMSKAFPGHPAAMGFNHGRSTALHVRIHSGAWSLASVDIRGFFDSVRRDQVWEALALRRTSSTGVRASPFAGWSGAGIELLTHACVLSNERNVETLPQGAPSSPVIANLVAQILDEQIESWGTSYTRYTRYADDLVLSSTYSATRATARHAADRLGAAIRSMGWEVNPDKVRTWWDGQPRPVLAGLELPSLRSRYQPELLRLPRKTRRRVRHAVHHARQGHMRDHERGLLCYAYAATAAHGLLVLTGNSASKAVDRLAGALCGPEQVDDFRVGWVAGDLAGVDYKLS